MVFPIAAALGSAGSIFIGVITFLGIILGGDLVKLISGLILAYLLISSGVLPTYMSIIIIIGIVLFFMKGGKR